MLSHTTHGVCLHHFFAESVNKQPDAIALIDCNMGNSQQPADHPGQRLSYAELEQRASDLARHLQEQGVVAGALVAIHLPRGMEQVIAVLAVTRLGAAWLALPMDLPAQRLAFMLQDSAACALIAKQDIAQRPDPQTRLILPQEAVAQRPLLPALQQDSDSVAFCIYTSGSTGTPKAVLVTHSGLPNLIAAQRQWFGVRASDRVLQFASFGFDAFVFEMVMAFANGAALVLRSEDVGHGLLEWMHSQQVSIATLPPTWLAMSDLRHLRHLRCVVSAGEACQAQHLQNLPADCAFINAYGPTEATIWVSAYRVTAQDAQQASVPIGQPIDGVEILILDQQQRVVVAGQSGEICIAGAGLARGYLHQAALTAEKFCTHPQRPEQRIYRTGDLGRLRADGNLEYLGRQDHQVKIRGFRIELGEIEAALQQHAAVRQAVVLAREDSPGQKRLVAYLLAETGTGIPTPGVEELRQHLLGLLPAYMLPAAWVFLPALPQNVNGKVDRKALPAPEMTRAVGLADEYVAPRTALESMLAEVLAEVLQIDQVGVHDGFYSLGGSSIQALEVGMRVTQRLAREGGLPLPLGNISIAEYAVKLEQYEAENASNLTTLKPASQSSAHAVSRYPASFAQQQVCFLEQLGDAWRAYRCHSSLRLRGALRQDVLQQAINQLIARHDILRTSFVMCDGQLQGQLAEKLEISLPCFDLSALTGAELMQAVQEHTAQALNYRFDISRAPLVYWHLIKLAQDDHLLFQTEHHNVHDGLSFRLMLRDIAEMYTALCQQRPLSLPAVPASYGEYCLHEAAWLQSPVYGQELAAWLQHLQAHTEVPRLFAKRQAASQAQPAGRFVGAQVRSTMPEALFEQVNRCAAMLGVSRFVLMLAVFGILCARHSGESAFLIGSALANRNTPRFRATVGMFVNMLPLPFAVQADTSFAALCQTLAQHTNFALAHSAVPLAEVVKGLGLSQRLQGEPPFNVAFSFHDSMPANPQFAGLQVEVEEALGNGSAKFDLSMVGLLGNQSASHSMQILFEYNSDIFSAATVQEMVEQYFFMLQTVLDDPALELASLPLLPPAQQQQVLQDCSGPLLPLAENACVIREFAAQVERTPLALAVASAEQQLSYAELHAQADCLAALLRQKGIGRQSLVGIYLPASVQMIVAVFAVMKAGAAYLPLDPEYPAQRLQYMVQDAQPALVLSLSSLHQAQPVAQNWLCLDSLAPQMAELASSKLAHHADGFRAELAENSAQNHDLAYVIYTSGSSGQPKGVAITRRNLAASNTARLAYYRNFGRYMLLSSLAFDSSVAAIFGVLCSGGSLHLPQPESKRDAAMLLQELQQAQINSLLCVPSLWNEILHLASQPGAQASALAASLQNLILAGEALPAALLERSRHSLPQCKIFNEYGPTEATVWASVYVDAAAHSAEVADSSSLGSAPISVPIGRPIANTRMYLLDADLHLLPAGACGEIYIAGPTVAAAYLQQPGLTAERFLADPFVTEAGARMYKTGDLGRYRADGNLEFLGRSDQQIKLNGFRIELGEIEQALLQIAGVREAAVLAHPVADDGMGGLALCAYLVLEAAESAGEAGEDAARFARFSADLQQRLPAHMIPQHWCCLPRLPHNANGKLDRRALPAPLATAPVKPVLGDEEDFSPQLQAVLAILRTLMPGAGLLADDDILNKGMHSILLMRFAAQCSEQLGLRIKVRDIYKAKTARAIAAKLEQVAA